MKIEYCCEEIREMFLDNRITIRDGILYSVHDGFHRWCPFCHAKIEIRNGKIYQPLTMLKVFIKTIGFHRRRRNEMDIDISPTHIQTQTGL